MRIVVGTYLRRFVAIAAALAVLCAGSVAFAHPHVWIISAGTLLYDANGQLTGIRYAWEFDEGYSEAAVQGLDTNKDGKLSREELADLAKTNAEALQEFDYFTFAKLGSRKLKFAAPIDYFLERNEAGLLVLHFTLPFEKPAAAKGSLRLDMYDPTLYVAFSLIDGDTPITLQGAPAGCSVAVERPQPLQPGQPMTLSESFFNSLSANSDFGAKFANRATVKCP